MLAVRLSYVASLVALTACGASSRGPYESCRSAPREWNDGMSRAACTSSEGGVEWDRCWHSQEQTPIRIALSKKDCLYRVTLQQADGTHVFGPYESVYEDSFRSDRTGSRLVFVAYPNDGAVAVIDGVESEPYRGFIWPPWFSANGRHAGFLAKKAKDAAVAVVDGRVVLRGKDFHSSVFALFDDGGIVAGRKRDDGKYEVVAGGFVSAPFDGFCDSRALSSVPSGQWAAVGMRGDRYAVLVNGQELNAPGIPANCSIEFSPDGAHYGYVVLPSKRDAAHEAEAGVVADGKYYAGLKGGNGIEFAGGVVIARLLNPDPTSMSLQGYRRWESTLVMMGMRTPAAAPVDDGYKGTDSWTRMRIGDSLGPRFDTIGRESIRVGDDGRVMYTGKRMGTPYEVVDNVIKPHGCGGATIAE